MYCLHIICNYTDIATLLAEIGVPPIQLIMSYTKLISPFPSCSAMLQYFAHVFYAETIGEKNVNTYSYTEKKKRKTRLEIEFYLAFEGLSFLFCLLCGQPRQDPILVVPSKK
jgi:hypothetical protein